MHVTKLGQRFDRCPKAWLRDEGCAAQEMLADYSWLKRYGILPCSGGRLDQHPRFLEAVEIIEREMALEAKR